jgi:hypothetical protein
MADYECLSFPARRRKAANCTCAFGAEKIAAEEEYIREASIYDGCFQDHKWHPECYDESVEDHPVEFSPYTMSDPTKTLIAKGENYVRLHYVSEKTQKAQKRYLCNFCEKGIAPGAEYVRSVAVCRGVVYTPGTLAMLR